MIQSPQNVIDSVHTTANTNTQLIDMTTRHSDDPLVPPRRHADDWEDWEDNDDDVMTLIDMNEPLPTYGTKGSEDKAATPQPLRSISPTRSPRHSPKQTNTSSASARPEPAAMDPKPSQNLTLSSSLTPGHSNARKSKGLSTRTSRHATGRISRHSQRRRQNPATSKLRLITDLPTFRRMNQAHRVLSPEVRGPKFVDAAALAALEGEPTPMSVGNWNWLKKSAPQNQQVTSPQQNARSPDQELSPDDRPIVIGIKLGSVDASIHQRNLQTAPVNAQSAFGQPVPRVALTKPSFADAYQPKSVWSPDTPDTACSFSSSVYSQITIPGVVLGTTTNGAPPVPAVPDNYKKMTGNRFLSLRMGKDGEDEDDLGTPCTLFEEDGTPVGRRSVKAKQSARTPNSANSQKYGWWDHHLVTPFLDKTMSLASRIQRDSMMEEISPKTVLLPLRMSRTHKPQDDYPVLPPLTFQSTQPPQNLSKDAHKGQNERDVRNSMPLTKSGTTIENGLLITLTPVEPADASAVEHFAKKEQETLAVAKPSPVDAQAPVVKTKPPPESISSPKQSIRSMEAPKMAPGRSTPILKIPTPRRTPSPATNLKQIEADSTQVDAPQKKSQPIASDKGSVDIPPPYSPERKELLLAPVSYQAVLPAEQTKDARAKPDRKRAPGLASTLTSQGPSRRMGENSIRPENALMIITARPSNASTTPQSESKQAVPDASQPAKTAAIAQIAAQSRFSVSPTSAGSGKSLVNRASTTERRILPHLRKPSLFSTRTVESRTTIEEQVKNGFFLDLECLPKNPARAFLAREPAAPHPVSSEGAARSGEIGHAASLPVRPMGTYLPEEHSLPAEGPAHKVERQRRRHEKEDVAARRLGSFWSGRGCIPTRGCFGRLGREGRQKRRIWMSVIAAIIAIIILATVLGIVLAKHGGSQQPHSIWVNLTDYPPMPTGVLTFVGPDNTVSRSGCTEPSTLWSCSLPKDQQASVSPFKANQPTVIFQIDWDNSTSNGWNMPNGSPPATLQARDQVDGFQPNPSPPSFDEMWFLGQTTDNITSADKAGEPTPFFISLLDSVNDTVKPPTLSRRSVSQGTNDTVLNRIPPPDLEADGTPKDAVMIPNPVQQPVRLYDRGLPTEHYGFYTYFKRTIYLKSVKVLNQTQGNVALDEDGGCRKTEANYLVTWAQTRMLVQIWTKQLEQNSSSLLSNSSADGGNKDESKQLIRPGTMPYPVTITLDTHGGDGNQKLVWDWPMDDRQHLSLDKAELLANNMAAGGSWINHRGNGDAKYGGFDGGSGGCQCQWVNFV